MNPSILPSPAPQAAARTEGAPERGSAAKGAWQEAEFSFGDLIDLVNPLQHIPIVNKIYREITGDGIGVAPRIAGGALFGGILGLAATLLDTALESLTGKDATETVLSALRAGEMDELPADYGTDVADILGYANTDVAASQEEGPAAAPANASTPLQASAQPVAAPAQPVAAPAQRPFQAGAPRPLETGMAQPLQTSVPQPLQTSVPLGRVRGVAAPSLPSPQVLAANPNLVNVLRTGPAAVRMLDAAGSAAGGSTPTGPQGLATATIARAVAGYGAAQSLVPGPRR